MKKIFLAILLLAGCAQKATKTYVEEPVLTKDRKPVDAKTIVIDARPPFQHAVAKVPGSLPMQWQDFSQKEDRFAGLLELDLFFHARRLARLGISPESSILVVGNGRKGAGEEGRVAWTLRVMGIKNVKFAHIERYQISGNADQAPPPQAVALWKPEIDASLTVDRKQFEGVLFQPRVGLDAPVIIDVRPVEEYTEKAGRNLSIDYGAVNIPWTEFITAQGEPNPAVVAKLEAVGITRARRVIFIDWLGVRSAMATIVLKDFGFNASNYAGGYTELEP